MVYANDCNEINFAPCLLTPFPTLHEGFVLSTNMQNNNECYIWISVTIVCYYNNKRVEHNRSSQFSID
jgi:hypothetical protein